MSEHDPLCGAAVTRVGSNYVMGCNCELISIVREDALAAAVQRVEAIEQGNQMLYTTAIRDAIAAIKGEDL